jgi:hypothetical protein
MLGTRSQTHWSKNCVYPCLALLKTSMVQTLHTTDRPERKKGMRANKKVEDRSVSTCHLAQDDTENSTI